MKSKSEMQNSSAGAQASTLADVPAARYEIELRPHPDAIRRRGCKQILVNGEEWGVVRLEQRGTNGSAYYFEQLGEGTIQEPSHIGIKGEQRYRDVRVWSDKIARRQLGGVAGNALPALQNRLLAKIRELIADGVLRSPAVVRAEAEAANVAYRERLRQQDAAKLESFRQKAAECLAADDKQAAIVEALLWAQSQ